jgi:catechol 2,3-dioxygenase-like lactoylglutathione lyase family enzyme
MNSTQEDAVPSTKTRIEKIGTVVVPVSDQDRAIDFYVNTLGFEKRTDMPFGNGYRWVEVAPANATTTIAIVPPPPGKPSGNAETGIALNTPDVDADHADLKSRGVDVDDEVSRMGDPVPPMFWFRDPDGNSLLIVEGN